MDDAEQRYRAAKPPTSLEDMALPTIEQSHLHPMGQVGDMLAEQGVDVLRDKLASAAEPVSKETGGMGYVRGSHRWKLHSPNAFVSQMPSNDAGLPALPDIEGNEDDYDIAYFEVEPGDVIVHDYRLTHGSRGNTSLERTRRAVSLRFAGDDATVLHRPSAPAEFPVNPNLKDGDVLDSTTYPVVWPSG